MAKTPESTSTIKTFCVRAQAFHDVLNREPVLRSRNLFPAAHLRGSIPMIRKLKSGEYRLYSRKTNRKTGRRRNLGTFKTRAEAEKHERAVQYFKRRG